MKIAYDARHLCLPYTGLGRYSYQLLCALLRLGRAHEVTICLCGELRAPGNPLADGLRSLLRTSIGDSARLEYVPARPFTLRAPNLMGTRLRPAARPGACVSLSRHIFQIWLLRLPWPRAARSASHFAPIKLGALRHHLRSAHFINRSGCDLYFFPHFDPPIGLKVPFSFVVHDLFPLAMSDYVTRWRAPKLLYFKSILPYGLKRARQVVCVSNSTREDLFRFMGRGKPDLARKVMVAGVGPTLIKTVARAGPKTPYLLYVGDRRPHKNLRRMVDVYQELRAKHGYRGDFLILGSPRNFNLDLDAYVRGKEGIRLIPNVSDAELKAFYSGCEALFFLSRYEGFGIPILEAAQHNRKIITSNGTALAEVAPPGSLKLDPYGNPAELAARIADYLRSGPVDYGNFGEKYTWDRAAADIFGVAGR